MGRRLRLGLRLQGLGTLDPSRKGNMQGDEAVARAWQKYLSRRTDVEIVHLYGPEEPMVDDLDVLVHFNPFLSPHPRARNILYLQNAFPPDAYPGGTKGVFDRVKGRFDGYLFTSRRLMSACADGGVVPFATDPEVFAPQPSAGYRHQVSFVGNDIRGPVANQRYLVPALPFGLVIYGNNTWPPPLRGACRGKIAAAELPKLYSSTVVNLNVHIGEHVVYDTVNLRVYDVLACAGFLLSDELDSLRSEFGPAVASTTGDEDTWAQLVRYGSDPDERRRRGDEGRRIVLSRHTYVHRMEAVMSYLRATL
jgi:spore maturation protein CgeB